MNFFWAVILGILQGLTEFLPVSSSGHLVLAQEIIPGFTQPGILFDVILHAGTLFSVLLFFRKRLFRTTPNYLFLLLISTVPAGVVGVVFSDVFENMFTSRGVVGVTLLITGVLNILTDRRVAKKENYTKKDAFFVGVAQAVAIIPGISRSGSTIFAGVMRSIKKEKAAVFSFLLSVPAILGATLMQILKHGVPKDGEPLSYLGGFSSAFVFGYIAIYLVFRFLSAGKFKWFGFYCLVLGTVALVF